MPSSWSSVGLMKRRRVSATGTSRHGAPSNSSPNGALKGPQAHACAAVSRSQASRVLALDSLQRRRYAWIAVGSKLVVLVVDRTATRVRHATHFGIGRDCSNSLQHWDLYGGARIEPSASSSAGAYKPYAPAPAVVSFYYGRAGALRDGENITTRSKNDPDDGIDSGLERTRDSASTSAAPASAPTPRACTNVQSVPGPAADDAVSSASRSSADRPDAGRSTQPGCPLTSPGNARTVTHDGTPAFDA